MKKPLVVGNWKRYIETPQDAKKFATALRRKSRSFSGADVMLAPAFPLIPAVHAALSGSSVGLAAQALSAAEGPQHTGDISAAMLKAAGVSAVIVGHSERRAAGESDAMVNAQVLAAHAAGLRAIVCIGERERDPSGGHFALIEGQLREALRNFPKSAASKLVVAYEPVWAIGKSAAEAMKPAELREMAIFIRKTLADLLERSAALRVPVLYGGSVEPENAASLLVEGDVAGFLVGHASASLDSFLAILTACTQ